MGYFESEAPRDCQKEKKRKRDKEMTIAARPRSIAQLYEADAQYATDQVRPLFRGYALCPNSDARFEYLNHSTLHANPFAPCLIGVNEGRSAIIRVVFWPMQYKQGPRDRATLHHNQVYAVERVVEVLTHPVVEVCQLDVATLCVSDTQNIPYNRGKLNEAMADHPDDARLPELVLDDTLADGPVEISGSPLTICHKAIALGLATRGP